MIVGEAELCLCLQNSNVSIEMRTFLQQIKLKKTNEYGTKDNSKVIN